MHSAWHAASRTSIFFSVYIIRTQTRPPPPPYVQCSFEKNIGNFTDGPLVTHIRIYRWCFTCVRAAATAWCGQFVATLEGIIGQEIIPFHREVDGNCHANF